MEVADMIARYRALMEGAPDEGVLASELAETHGVSLKTARQIIRALIDAGQVKRASRYIVRIDGTRQRVPSYRLVTND